MVGLLQALSRGKLRRIKSSELEAELKSILCLALEHDLTIAWVWAARDEPIIQVSRFSRLAAACCWSGRCLADVAGVDRQGARVRMTDFLAQRSSKALQVRVSPMQRRP